MFLHSRSKQLKNNHFIQVTAHKGRQKGLHINTVFYFRTEYNFLFQIFFFTKFTLVSMLCRYVFILVILNYFNGFLITVFIERKISLLHILGRVQISDSEGKVKFFPNVLRKVGNLFPRCPQITLFQSLEKTTSHAPKLFKRSLKCREFLHFSK